MYQLVFKLLLKATLPLVLLVGALSYGVYMRGGDPSGILKRVAGGMFGQLQATGRDVRESAGRLVTPQDDTPSARHQRFYTWVDERGVRHYSSEAPAGGASTVSVDSERNLIRAVTAPARPAAATRSPVSQAEGRAPESTQPVLTGLERGAPRTTGAHRSDRASGSAHVQGGGRGDARGSSSDTAEGVIPGMAGIALPDGVERRELLELLR